MNLMIIKIWKSKLWLLITVAVLVAINWLASLYHTRIDFTNEKRFTLSSATKKVLHKLDDVVQVDVFLKGDFPSGFKKLANSTGELLQEFKEVAGKKLQYRFISPDEDVEGTNIKWADTLAALGFYPINLTSQVKAGQQQQNIYPVAFVHYKDKVLPVILYQGKTKAITYPEINSAEAMMEFNFISAIDKLLQKEKPIIGYTVGNGQPTGYTVEDLVKNTLQQEYRFYSINPNTQPAIPKEFNVLFVVKPTEPFSDETKLKLDQYVMNGGKILFFVDKLIDMGAKIMLCDPHRAVVMGHDFKSQLKATTMSSPDIRAGISLLIAALSAKGTSTIQNIEQIDRGYERIDERLRAIGANIIRA